MQAEGSISLQISATKDVLSKQLAEFVIQKAAEAKREKGKFVVALSGGSLPKTLAKDLVTDDCKTRAEFSSWHVYFADERCVPLDHEDSNYGLSKTELFDKVDIPADQIYPIDPSLTPEECAAAYAKSLEAGIGEGIPVFDLLFLGIGPDGHTCSLFPGHPLLQENSKTVAHILDSPKPPPERVTLTYPVLNAAKEVVFVSTGSSKKDAMRSILKDPNSELPAKLVRPSNGSVTWFIDQDAADGLKN
ncbi:hypothetical protein NDN08_003045 [Rhodosorus marinus]|uniref:6-phosphogluconolactonase n=1 Tax=Rhodosorus marinus TaxID=101924 RepID=A0AAV8UZX1_9RHOD|nr:hypothetical protein NDN08_003045 [Rhodosorus marinus]